MSKRSPALSDNELHLKMRKRAYELADTGRYRDWPDIAVALNQEEDFHHTLVRALGNDALFVSMLNTRCRQARERQ
jgi:hypothetical protein